MTSSESSSLPGGTSEPPPDSRRGETPSAESPCAVPDQKPRWLVNWLLRHQHPVSRWLHAVGIPLTIAALVLAGVQLAAWRWDLWYRPVVLLFGGYFLQWLGHVIEGNEMGEVILVKRWLGRPYVAVSPRYQRVPATAGDPQEPNTTAGTSASQISDRNP